MKKGREIALQTGLPEVVADFIPQHHGTLLLEYFYDKAAKANPGAEVREEDFRYPGPKPQSVEAAILMIVDAVEVTLRTIQEPTREKIETMVRHISKTASPTVSSMSATSQPVKWQRSWKY
jgi:cyclic-di-AMP phosphodiesterase PgpH